MGEKSRMAVRDITYLGMMLAIIEVSKKLLEFLPNVELVTLLFILFAYYFGWKVIWVSFAFTALETFFWGINTWNVMYLYIWPLLILIVILTRKWGSYLFYSFLSAFFGLFFGALCTIPYFFIGGVHMAITWWIAGLPYDVIHCVSNFILCLVLFQPLNIALKKITSVF